MIQSSIFYSQLLRKSLPFSEFFLLHVHSEICLHKSDRHLFLLYTIFFLPGFGGQSWWIILLWTTYPWIHIRVHSEYVFLWGGVHIFISLFLSSKAFLLLYSSEAVVFSFINFISISISFFPHMSVKVVVSASYLLSRCRFFHYNLFPCHCFMKLRFILDVISTRDWVTARLLQFPWIGSSNRIIQTLSNFKYVYVPLGLGLKGKLYLTGL